jgi:serine/threonine protein kinase
MIRRCGDFELTRHLTSGGIADLFLARSPRYESELVIKRLQPRYLGMTPVVNMFLDEGQIVQALCHPNVVKVFEVGHDGDEYFIAMEYVPGWDLLSVYHHPDRELALGEALPRHIAVAILAQVARGLIHVHERTDEEGRPLRIVHCDLSPANIVLSRGGTAKIVDFGIARATIQKRTEEEGAGKYNYMAPEQIRGEPLDARADLFAMGVILYELTLQRRLFSGAPERVMRRALEEQIPRPSEIHPDYPNALEEVVMRALERDRACRTVSARELYAGLADWLQRTGLPYGKRAVALCLRAAFGAADERDDRLEEDDEDPEPESPPGGLSASVLSKNLS